MLKPNLMKYNKVFCVVAPLIFGIITFSCSSKKYIRELPYHYSSEDFSKTSQTQKQETDSNYSAIDDNPEGLSDDVLKIREKYSIIMEVMPK